MQRRAFLRQSTLGLSLLHSGQLLPSITPLLEAPSFDELIGSTFELGDTFHISTPHKRQAFGILEYTEKAGQLNAPVVELKSHLVDSSRSFMKKSRIDFAMEGRYLSARMNVSTNIYHDLAESENCVTYVLRYYCNHGKFRLSAQPKFTQVATDDLARHGPANFMKLFGTHYVDEVEKESEMLCIVNVSTGTSQLTRQANHALGGKVSGISFGGSMQGGLSNFISEASRYGTVKVEFRGVGIDLTKNIFAETDTDAKKSAVQTELSRLGGLLTTMSTQAIPKTARIVRCNYSPLQKLDPTLIPNAVPSRADRLFEQFFIRYVDAKNVLVSLHDLNRPDPHTYNYLTDAQRAPYKRYLIAFEDYIEEMEDKIMDRLTVGDIIGLRIPKLPETFRLPKPEMSVSVHADNANGGFVRMGVYLRNGNFNQASMRVTNNVSFGAAS